MESAVVSDPRFDRIATEYEASRTAGAGAYIESLAEFLAEEDPPDRVIFPDLLPAGVIMLLHGEPRSRKSLAAFELALAAATGTAPFGLARFHPAEPIGVLYIQEEDPRALTRQRVRRLVAERCGADLPKTLSVSIRRGVNLDDPDWVTQIAADLSRLGIRLLVLDAARRFSVKTDEGPTKVSEFTAVLRHLVTTTGVSIIIVHHDVKPPITGHDGRRRSQRASGGDWFAVAECPVHVEKIGPRESLIFPEDYKFTADPAPFTFTYETDGALITRLYGVDTTTEQAERAGVRGKVRDWLRTNGPAHPHRHEEGGARPVADHRGRAGSPHERREGRCRTRAEGRLAALLRGGRTVCRGVRRFSSRGAINALRNHAHRIV
jgi:hypothetical protein